MVKPPHLPSSNRYDVSHLPSTSRYNVSTYTGYVVLKHKDCIYESHPLLVGEFPSLSSLGASFYSHLKDSDWILNWASLNWIWCWSCFSKDLTELRWDYLVLYLTEKTSNHSIWLMIQSLKRLLKSLLRLGLNHLNTIRTELITGLRLDY